MIGLDGMVTIALVMVSVNFTLALLIFIRRFEADWRARRLAAAISLVAPDIAKLITDDDPAEARARLVGARRVRRAAIIISCAEHASKIVGARKLRVTELLTEAGYLDRLHRQAGGRVDWRAARACTMLGKIGSASSVDVLVSRLGHHNLELHSEAAQALGRIGLPECAPPLVDALERTTPSEAIGAVFHAVMELGPPGTAAFIALLESDSPRFRRLACLGLSLVDPHLAYAASVPQRIADVALQDPSLEVRRAALDALGELGDPAGLRAVCDGMESLDPFERAAAARAARSLPTSEVLPGLAAAARSNVRPVAYAAGRSLVALIMVPEFQSEVERCLEGPQLPWGFRRAIIERAMSAG